MDALDRKAPQGPSPPHLNNKQRIWRSNCAIWAAKKTVIQSRPTMREPSINAERLCALAVAEGSIQSIATTCPVQQNQLVRNEYILYPNCLENCTSNNLEVAWCPVKCPNDSSWICTSWIILIKTMFPSHTQKCLCPEMPTSTMSWRSQTTEVDRASL